MSFGLVGGKLELVAPRQRLLDLPDLLLQPLAELDRIDPAEDKDA